MLVPLGSDVRMAALPWVNWVLILVTVIAFCLQGDVDWQDPHPLPWLALDGPGIGIVGHVFVHAGVVHLLGNMLFLWVFGNAIGPRLGAVGYPLFYLASAAFVGVLHVLVSDKPVVGASGAINAVVGMFVVVHPTSRVRTFFNCGLGPQELPAWLLVLCWLAYDLLGIGAEASMASVAHVAGLVFGFVAAVVLLRAGLIPIANFEVTLLDLPVGSWLAGGTQTGHGAAKKGPNSARPPRKR